VFCCGRKSCSAHRKKIKRKFSSDLIFFVVEKLLWPIDSVAIFFGVARVFYLLQQVPAILRQVSGEGLTASSDCFRSFFSVFLLFQVLPTCFCLSPTCFEALSKSSMKLPRFFFSPVSVFQRNLLVLSCIGCWLFVIDVSNWPWCFTARSNQIFVVQVSDKFSTGLEVLLNYLVICFKSLYCYFLCTRVTPLCAL
jgi:hypothetical protein